MTDHQGRPEEDTRTDTTKGVVGLSLMLAAPAAGLVLGVAMAVMGLPGVVGALPAALLPAGMALVATVAPTDLRGRMAAAAGLAGIAFLLGLVVAPSEVPGIFADPQEAMAAAQLDAGQRVAAAANAVLLGAAVLLFGLAMRRWMRDADEGAATTWWTIYAAVAVPTAVAGAATIAVVPTEAGTFPGGTVLLAGLLTGLLGIAQLVAQVGACISGIIALRRRPTPSGYVTY